MSITRTVIAAQPGHSVICPVIGTPDRLKDYPDGPDHLEGEELCRRAGSWAGLWGTFRYLVRRRWRRNRGKDNARVALDKPLNLTAVALSYDPIVAWMVTHKDGEVIEVTPITVDARQDFPFDPEKHAIAGPGRFAEFVYFPPNHPGGGGSYMMQGAEPEEVLSEFRRRLSEERAAGGKKTTPKTLNLVPKDAS